MFFWIRGCRCLETFFSFHLWWSMCSAWWRTACALTKELITLNERLTQSWHVQPKELSKGRNNLLQSVSTACGEQRRHFHQRNCVFISTKGLRLKFPPHSRSPRHPPSWTSLSAGCWKNDLCACKRGTAESRCFQRGDASSGWLSRCGVRVSEDLKEGWASLRKSEVTLRCRVTRGAILGSAWSRLNFTTDPTRRSLFANPSHHIWAL